MGRSTVLAAWVGSTDLRAPTDEDSIGLGPVAQAVGARCFDEVVLLSNYAKAEVKAWTEYKASRFETPPGVAAGAVLESGSEQPRCWWAPFETVAENEFNLAASRYKPWVSEKASDEDPAELLREVLAIEREIATGLEKLLEEIEA